MASPSDGPSWEDIERAWVRSRPSAPPWRRKWHRSFGKSLRIFAAVWTLLLLGGETSAILDVAFGFGWGYRPVDALYGLLMIPAGAFIFALIWLVHRAVAWMSGVGGEDL